MQQNETAQMLSALFEGAEHGFIELRVIRRQAPPVQEWFRVGEAGLAAARAVDLRERGDVYCGVVPRTRQEGTKDAVGASTVVWLDLDSPDSLLELMGFVPPPTLVVASGSPGCHHAYWLLSAPIDKTHWRTSTAVSRSDSGGTSAAPTPVGSSASRER